MALLQSRLRTLLLALLHHTLRSLGHQAPLPLLLNVLLLLAERQGVGDAEKQDGRRDDPQTFAAVRDGVGGRRVDCR